MKKYILGKDKSLYRYDLVEPPKQWDDNYRNNQYLDINNISKNLTGFYYFFDNKETAILTGDSSIKDQNRDVWITSTHPIRDLLLLDLRGGSTLVMLNILQILDPNFFNRGFTINGKQNDTKIKTLEREIDNILIQDQPRDILENSFSKICYPFLEKGRAYSLLGQYLSDYENGNILKEILIEESLDGYIFDECDSSSTICLIDHKNLVCPITEKYNKETILNWKINKNKFGI